MFGDVGGDVSTCMSDELRTVSAVVACPCAAEAREVISISGKRMRTIRALAYVSEGPCMHTKTILP
jgi:hypothetical protein